MCNDLISVIIPVYKVPVDMLNKCISSVISQEYANLEIILVDDGSPDNCGEICDSFEIKDDRIKVIHQSNKGLCGARNTGVKYSSGKWITFLDGDDWIDENCFSSLVDFMKQDLDLIIFGTIKDFASKSVKYNYGKLIEPNRIYNNNDAKIFQKATLDFGSSIGDVTARLINKNLIDKYDIYHDEEIKQGVEAIEFNIRLLEWVNSAVLVDKYFYHYTFNDQSITNAFSEEKCYITLKGYNVISNYIKKQDNYKELQDMLYLRIIHNIVSTAISGFFSPTNNEKFSIKKDKYKKYISMPLIKETLSNVDNSKIDSKQKIILFFIKNRLYFVVSFFAKIRYIQKNK